MAKTTTKKIKKPTLGIKGGRIGRPPMAADTVNLSLRVVGDMIVALDRYVVALGRQSPGFTVTRNDAMRRLLIVGLAREGFPIGPVNDAAKESLLRG